MTLHHLMGIWTSNSICVLSVLAAHFFFYWWSLPGSCKWPQSYDTLCEVTLLHKKHALWVWTSRPCLRDMIRLFSQRLGDAIPSVHSWSMALMMRSHSSARVQQPHSPSSGTYSSSFCSSSVSGTLMPNSSGNVAAQREETQKPTKVWYCNVVTYVREDVCALWFGYNGVTYHHQGWAPYPKDSSSPCLHYPSWMRNSVDMNHRHHHSFGNFLHRWPISTANNRKWMPSSINVFQILCDHQHPALTKIKKQPKLSICSLMLKVTCHWRSKSRASITKSSARHCHCKYLIQTVTYNCFIAFLGWSKTRDVCAFNEYCERRCQHHIWEKLHLYGICPRRQVPATCQPF